MFNIAILVADYKLEVWGFFGREKAQRIAKKELGAASGQHVVAERRHAGAVIGRCWDLVC